MRGGLHLIAHKQRSIGLASASTPPQLTFSISPAQESLEMLVRAGDFVQLGQPLTRSLLHTTHASISGQVITIERTDAAYAITVQNDGLDQRHPSLQALDHYSSISPEHLRKHIHLAGVLGLGGASFPTAAKLHAAASRRTELLIVNGAECEPFITCDDMLMRECADEIVFGTQALLHASGAARAVIAVENDKPEASTAIVAAIGRTQDPRLRLQTVDAYYPAGGERQLIATIAQREVPSGGTPADIGVLCQNVGTAAAIARLIRTGEPLISRVVTLTGSGIREARNLRARFGTPIASLIADCGGYVGDATRLIVGGTMMGIAIATDAETVNAATNCIVVATASDIIPRGVEMPCIRCGDCAQVCPAGLLPQQLLRYAQQDNRAALEELGIRDCIECGCCDYVCPSQIPLTATFVALHRNP